MNNDILCNYCENIFQKRKNNLMEGEGWTQKERWSCWWWQVGLGRDGVTPGLGTLTRNLGLGTKRGFLNLLRWNQALLTSVWIRLHTCFLSKSDVIIHLSFIMHLKTNCLKTRYKILQLLIGFASLATNNFAFVLKLCFWKIGRLSDLKFHFSKMNYSTQPEFWHICKYLMET